MGDLRRMLREIGGSSTSSGRFPGQPMRNALSPDINSREQIGALTAKAIDTVDDPDGLPNHLLDPTVDPEECLGPVGKHKVDPPYVTSDPFARDVGPQPFSGGGAIRR